MSTVKTNNVQIGQSVTATNNFTWYQPASPDGTVRLGNGNSGSVTDLVTLTSAGNLGVGTSSPGYRLEVAYGSTSDALVITGSVDNITPYLSFKASNGGSSYIRGRVRGTAPDSTNGGLAFDTGASGSMSEKMRLDSSGNLGLGVTPSGWSSTYKALDLNTYGAIASNAGSVSVWANGYFNGSNSIYKNSNYALIYNQIATAGQHAWYIAPSGTAGNVISWTQAMTLDASGNLLVGTTSSPTGSPVGKVLALSGVDIEGTAAINVTTSTTLLSRTSGVGGMFFVQGYNASGGAQGWWLLACIGATLTTIASNNATGLTVTFSSPGGGLRAVTASGTLIATCVAFTM